MIKANKLISQWIFVLCFSTLISQNVNAVVTWDGSEGIGQNIFTANPSGSSACTNCHQSSSPTYSPSLATHAQVSAYQNNATHVSNDDDPNSRIQGDSGVNSMPFGEALLSSDQRTLMAQWVTDGTLENAAPGISNLASSSVSYTTATLSADLYENGANATMSFEYSTSSSLSGSTTHNPTTDTGTGTGGGTSADATITGSLTGLRCGTTYYYRAVATNSVGTTNSHTSGYPSFTTSSCPSIPAQSISGATENANYSQSITATNPGSFSLTWDLVGEPSGMTINSSGLISWDLTNDDDPITSDSFNVQITYDRGDGVNAAASRGFTVNVTTINDAPSITSTASTSATEDTLYTYTPTVSDPDDSNNGSDLSWSLSNEPSGMSVSSTGVVTWTPANGVSTSGTVTLTVEDGGEDGAAAGTENFTISVTAQNDPPSITSTAGTSATEDVQYTYTATVTDVDDSNNGTDLDWSLSNQPSGMVVSSTGVVTWTPGEGVTTSGTVTLTVEDGREDGASPDTENFTISVTAVNDSPVISSTASTSATEDTLYTYTPSVSDPDDSNNGTDLSWSLSNEPSGMSVSSTGVVTWTPGEGVTTSGTVTLTVEDGGEDSAVAGTENFTISVTAVNDSPVITSTASTSATEDVLYTYTPTVSDPDDSNNGTDMSWSLSNQPSGMAVDANTGVVTWTPANGVTTSGTVTLTVEDGGEDGAVAGTENFTISVTAVNDSPVITSTASATATEDVLYTYTPTVNDPDDSNNGSDLTWSLSNQPSGMAINTGTGVVNWTPTEGVTTSGTVTLTVEDGGEDGAVAGTENFTITVTAVNDSPVITSTASTSATEDVLYTYTPTVSDPDDSNNGTDMSWSLSNQPSGMAVNANTGVVTWTPENGVSSSGTVTLTVVDGGEDGAVAGTENFSISVTAVNDAPIITSSASTTVVEGNLYTYTPTVNDPDDSNNGTDLTWGLSNQPTGMAINTGTGVVTWTPGNGVSTSGQVTLTVEDGGEDGAVGDSQTFEVNVVAFNTGPSITSTAGTAATEDVQYQYQVGVSDADDSNNGTDIGFVLSNEPSGMNVSTTGLITWTPTEGVTTSGTVTLTVSDGGEDGAGPDTENFTISVTAVNDSPVINSSAPATATEDTLYTYTPTVNDPDDTNNGSDMSWSISNQPTGMAVDTNTGVVTWTPTEGVTTSGTVTLSVVDGGEDGAVAGTENFTITVTAVNDSPTISSTAPTSATEDTLYTYTPTVSDPDDTNNGTDMSWSISNQPTGMAVDTNTGVVTWTPENGVTSSGTVTLTVEDGGEDGASSSSENFTVSVTAVNDSPVIDSTAPTSATEDVLYTYTPTVNDPDDTNNGTDMSWSISNQPTGMVVDTNTGVVTWTPENGVTTSGLVTLSVEDGGEDGAVAGTENFTITVTAVNDGPTITSSASTSIVEGNLYTYTPTVDDPDDSNNGTDLTWSLSNQPTGMAIDTGTGVVTWTPENGVSTSGTVTLAVEDGGEDGAVGDSQTFEVTVVPFNTGPSITSTAGTTATEDVEYQYQVDVSDADDSNNGTDIEFNLSNFPDGMAVSDTGLITWTPGNGVSTSGEVTLTVSDGGEDGALPATENFTIAVTAVNDAPVINSSAPDSATEDTLYSYTPDVTDVDDDNDGVDLSWALSNAPTGMSVDNVGVVTWTPENGVLSSGAVTLTVEDGGENDAQPDSETFTITVTAVNDAPEISSSPSTSALEDNLYSYQVEVTDVDDSDPATEFTFDLITAPDGMAISNLGLVTWTPPEGATSEAVSIRVRDGGEDSAEPAIQDFTISIGIFNTGPTIDSTAPTTATEDIEYQYQLAITDPDDENNGADLHFALVNAPDGMNVSDTGLISWTATEGVMESGTVTIEVRDGGEDDSQVATEDFAIEVTAVNDAPVITSVAPTAVIEINLYSYQVNIEDPDDSVSELSFELEGAPQDMTVDEQGLIQWIPPEGTRSSGEITLTVADGGEDSAAVATEVFTIEVTEFNTPPVITSIAPATATEDVQYSYQIEVDDIDDPNDGSGALRFWLFNAPEGMEISDTGLITWTPLEGVSNSGHFSANVADAGEDGAVAAQESIVIAVDRVNDAPSITSTPTTTVNEGELYTYQIELSDPDDDNNGVDFSFDLASAPQGMTISRVGLISWQTGADSPATSDIIVTVSDGGEDGVQPISQSFILSVDFDIDADGITNVEDNCPQTVNADQADNDADGQGDACDSDDDNDGMSDEFELTAGLDPFDPADADLDSDGDGTSNLDEFDSGSNPIADDIPPSVFAPLNVRLNSTGFETFVDIGQATATDSLNGPIEATSNRSSGLFRTGRHIITWSATDSLGNTATADQIVDVIPQVHIVSAMSAEEGQEVSIPISLNGDPVRYPVIVFYQVSGDAELGADHDLADGSVELNSMSGEIRFNIVDDDIAEGIEELTITLTSPRNAILGQSEHTLSIIEANIAPKVEMSVRQGEISGLIVSRDGGFVRVSTEVEDPNLNESFTYDWSETDNNLVPSVGFESDTFIFNPSELAFGIYKVKVRVTDTGGESTSNELLVRLDEVASIDEDADGIADDIDQSEAPFVLQAEPEGEALETEPGLTLQLGETATYDGADGGLIDLQSLQEHGDEGEPADASTDFTFSGGLYDFVIGGLGQVGQSVSVVIPQLEPVPENAIYRKFSADTGWRDFTVDDNNRLASTFSFDDSCPAPGSRAYQAGLNAGSNCVELTIEDGGPNDADGEANGVIRDPGGVGYSPNATPTAGHTGTVDTPDETEVEGEQQLRGKSGGGALHLFILWGLLVLLVASRRRSILFK